MSDLINKYEDTQLTPRGQITVQRFMSWDSKRKKEIKKIEQIKKCCVAVSILAIAFTAYNMHAYNKSFDNCLALLEQIETNTAVLDQKINSLRISMGEVVDYE